MAAPETIGPIQVYDNSVGSINDALRQLVDRINELTVRTTGDQDVEGTKTIVGSALRFEDDSGNLVHAIGGST